MTTAQKTRGPGSSPGVAGRVVRRALAATVVFGGLLAVAGQLVAGSPALAGVLVGTALVCGFFGLGGVVLIWVSRVSPAMTLLVGLMTYTLQVIVLGLSFAVLQASGLMESTVDGTWLGGTVIAGTVVWLALQVTLSLRARQPYFDLPETTAADAASTASGPRSDDPSEGRVAGRTDRTEPGAR